MRLTPNQFSVKALVGLFLLVTLMGWSVSGAAVGTSTSTSSTPSSTSSTSSRTSSTSTISIPSSLSSIIASLTTKVCSLSVFSQCGTTITTTVPGSTETITTTVAANQTVTQSITSTVTTSFTTFIPDMNGDCSVAVGGTDTTTTDYLFTIFSSGPIVEVGVGTDIRTCTGLTTV